MIFTVFLSVHHSLTGIKYHGHMLLGVGVGWETALRMNRFLLPRIKLNNDSESFRPGESES